MKKIILTILILSAPWFVFGCSKINAGGSQDNKPIYVERIPDAFQGQWVKDPANCSDAFGDNQINILENQLVFKTKIARPTELQLAGRALYINAKIETESGVKDESYKLIISANGKSLVASDGLERIKCLVN